MCSLMYSNLEVNDMHIQPDAYINVFARKCAKRCSLLPFWLHILLDQVTGCVTYKLIFLIYKPSVRKSDIIIITKFSREKEAMEPLWHNHGKVLKK